MFSGNIAQNGFQKERTQKANSFNCDISLKMLT